MFNKKIILIIFFSFFICNFSWAGDCDTTVSGTENNQLSCSDNDTLTVTGTVSYNNENAVLGTQIEDLTIINSGTIETTNTHSAVKAQSSLNLTVTNSGTILADEDYGINIISAEKVTITNEAGGIIKATPDNATSQHAIGGVKQGNCNAFACEDGSTSASTGQGLTLNNYGTIDAYSRTVYGGHADIHTSKKTKIYNFDGGMIDATASSAIKYQYAEDFELYNYSGATIQAGTTYTIDTKGASTVIIDNAGTISSGTTDTVSCPECADVTLTNTGTISAGSTNAVRLESATGTNTITNSGTISSVLTNAIKIKLATGVTITNEAGATVSADGVTAIDADNAYSPTITNYGTIISTTHLNGIGINLSQSAENRGSGATITNSGTIEASGANADGIKLGDSTGVYNDATITNSGTITAGDNSIWIDGSGTTGTNIITKGDATYTGEIDMESAVVTMTLDCSLSKDMDIEIHNKTNMTVTNNLCGNDTYEILDSSKNADADNSETNGYLRILGEDLDTPNENAKYRSENVLTKLRGLFAAANHISWNAPEEKFFKIFHSYQKREGIYDGSMSGAVGQLNPFNWGALRSNVFVGYTKQYGDFSNGEYLGGDNFALGLKNVYENNGFRASFTPMFGFNDLTITDYETDTKTSINTNILSEFAGINTKFAKEVELSKEGTLDLSVQTTYGVQKFPDYVAKFADGDLSVRESIEQVLSGGFAIKYSDDIGKGFIIQPYAGVNINKNFNDNIKITADGDNNNKSPANSETSGYYAGVSLTKDVKGMDFDLDLMYGNEDGLINQIVAFSLTKSFGKAKTAGFDVRDVRKKPDFPKVDESLTTQDSNKDLEKSENKVQKLKELALKTMQENQISKHLVKELLIENQRLQTIVEMFKNKERQNKNTLEESKQSTLEKLIFYNFLFIYFVVVFALTWLIGFLYNKIVFRASTQKLTV